MTALLPPNETARLRALWRYMRHDRAPDPALDAITRLTADLLAAPMAVISLVDEHGLWFKSRVGIEATDVCREGAFCVHTLLGEGLLEVPDTRADARFRHSPLVTGPLAVRYYFGAALITPDGYAIGALCILDTRPRAASSAQRRHLQTLAGQVMQHLECLRLAGIERSVTLAGLGTWELDVGSDWLWGNAELARLQGRETAEFHHCQGLVDDFLPADQGRLQAGLARVIHQGASLDTCLRLKPAGQPLRWVQLTATAVGEALPARQLVGTLLDVTALKAHQQQLEWYHRLDRLIHRLQSAFIAGGDMPGTFAATLETLLACTESGYGFIGEVSRDAQGRAELCLHAACDVGWDDARRAHYRSDGEAAERLAEDLSALCGEVLSNGEPLICNALAGDPRRAEPLVGEAALSTLLCLPIMLEDEVVAVLGLANRAKGFDAGMAQRLEPLLVALGQLVHGLRLRRRHDVAWKRLELSAKVFSSSREAIMITDADNRIIEVNEAFERITGYTRQEALGRDPRLLSSGQQSSAFYADMWQALTEHGHWQGEMLNQRKNGEPLPEQLAISLVHDGAGKVTHHVAVFSDLTPLKQHADELFRVGYYDPLTGMPNRAHCVELMHQALARCGADECLTVAVLDLDGFQRLNTRLGRDEADRVLAALGARLSEALAPGELIARLSGDEFALLLHHFTGETQRLEGLLERVAQPLEGPGNQSLRITASLGMTRYPGDDADPETLLRHADQAMYQAKMLGGNTLSVFDPWREQEARELQAQRQTIAAALAAQEFVLYFQPQLEARSRRVAGAEALIRWQHPRKGLLAPDGFLPAIADSDLELEMDAWVLHAALHQMEAWHDAGLAMGVCINLTPRSLIHDHFVTTLREALSAHPRVPPSRLCLEVLESAALEDFAAATRVMRTCRELGVEVALDDFGTGYSSLAYLRDLPVDVVKVDRRFVMSMLERERDLAIVESVVYLAQRFGKRVVAEGVESEAHIQRLAAMGCDLLQGFGIARPMPGSAFAGWCQVQAQRTAHAPRRTASPVRLLEASPTGATPAEALTFILDDAQGANPV